MKNGDWADLGHLATTEPEKWASARKELNDAYIRAIKSFSEHWKALPWWKRTWLVMWGKDPMDFVPVLKGLPTDASWDAIIRGGGPPLDWGMTSPGKSKSIYDKIYQGQNDHVAERRNSKRTYRPDPTKGTVLHDARNRYLSSIPRHKMHLIFWKNGSMSVELPGSDRLAAEAFRLAITGDAAFQQLTEDQDRLEMATVALTALMAGNYCRCEDKTGVTPSGVLVCLDTEDCEYAMASSVLVADYAQALPGEDYAEALAAAEEEE